MPVEQCPSTYKDVRCDQIEGHYPASMHRGWTVIDEHQNTRTHYWDTKDEGTPPDPNDAGSTPETVS